MKIPIQHVLPTKGRILHLAEFCHCEIVLLAAVAVVGLVYSPQIFSPHDFCEARIRRNVLVHFHQMSPETDNFLPALKS